MKKLLSVFAFGTLVFACNQEEPYKESKAYVEYIEKRNAEMSASLFTISNNPDTLRQLLKKAELRTNRDSLFNELCGLSRKYGSHSSIIIGDTHYTATFTFAPNLGPIILTPSN